MTATPADRSEAVWYLAKPVTQADLHASIARACAAPAGSARILLADDAVEMRGLVEAFLGAAYRVDWAPHGRAAIDMFKATPYTLVFADLEMPVMNGRELLRAIRQWERESQRARTPVVVLSGHVEAQGRDRVETPAGDALDAPPIIVTPDEEIADIAPAFLLARSRDVRELWQALSGGDYARIQRMGHRLKGSGRSYGFDRITDIGAALERAARSNDPAAIAPQIAMLRDYLRRVRLVGTGDATAALPTEPAA